MITPRVRRSGPLRGLVEDVTRSARSPSSPGTGTTRDGIEKYICRSITPNHGSQRRRSRPARQRQSRRTKARQAAVHQHRHRHTHIARVPTSDGFNAGRRPQPERSACRWHTAPAATTSATVTVWTPRMVVAGGVRQRWVEVIRLGRVVPQSRIASGGWYHAARRSNVPDLMAVHPGLGSEPHRIRPGKTPSRDQQQRVQRQAYVAARIPEPQPRHPVLAAGGDVERHRHQAERTSTGRTTLSHKPFPSSTPAPKLHHTPGRRPHLVDAPVEQRVVHPGGRRRGRRSARQRRDDEERLDAVEQRGAGATKVTPSTISNRPAMPPIRVERLMRRTCGRRSRSSVRRARR